MNYIKKIEIFGFKSFYNRKEINFPPGLNIIIGPNGSGKCLAPKAIVYLADGSTIQIKKLVEQKLKENKKIKIKDGWIASGDNTKILSLDIKKLKIASAPIQAYVKRKAPKYLLKIKTISGREITSTGYHPFFIKKNGKIVSAKADQLYKGQKIAVPVNSSINSKIAWDEIISIKKVYGVKWVYDLCIAKYHNFVANNIVVHNSNVIEAICFVLGKTSKKELRAERLGDLVFKGGKKLPPSNFAKVTIDIDNKNRVMPIDDDVVRISRKVDKEGHSIFRVNGQRQTMDYVRSILSYANIDPDGFNIILQGDISRFVDMSPEERRKIIEDTCGISNYEDKKHKCMLELDKVNQKIKEAEIILNEKKKLMEGLQKEKEQAEEYTNLQHTIRVKKCSKLLREKFDLEKVLSGFKKEFEKKEKELSLENEKLNKIVENIQKETQNVEEINKEISQKGEKEQIELNKKIESLKIRSSELKISIKNIENELKRAEERKTNILNEIENNKQLIKNLNESLSNYTKKIEEKTQLLHTEEERLEKLKNLDVERLSLISKLANVENQILVIKQQLDQFDKKIQEKNEMIKYEKEIEDLKKELQQKLDEDSKSVLLASELRGKHSSLLKEMHQLEGKREAILNLLKRGVKAILSAKAQGKLTGIHGTVSSLAKADDKYILPLKVAAGNKLSCIVVDNEDVAKECIDYLKSGQYGIATFLPLNKLKPKKVEIDSSLKKIEGVIGYAIDLVKFDKKYQSVFDYVFSNTLIVDNIETAKKVGINKIRMVTMDGILIEKSGAMVGGYRKKEIIGFKENELDDQIENIRSKLNEISNEISVYDSKHSKLSEDISYLRNKIYELELKIKDIDIDKTQYENLKKELNEKISNKNQILNQIDSLPKKVDESTIKKLNENVNNLREEINKLRAELHGVEIQIKIANNDIIDLQNVLKNLEKEKLLFSKNLAEDQKELSSVEKRLNEALEEEKKFHGELRELYEKRNKLNEKIKNLELEKVRIESEISKIKSEANEINLKIIEVNAKIESKIAALEEYKDIEIKEVNQSVEKLEQQIVELQTKLESFGAVNMRALDMYKEVEKEYNELKGRVDKLDQEKASVINAINEIESKKKESFMEAFDNIAKYFSSYFSTLSPNSEGKLVLENPEHPFEGGVEIIANPGGKKMISLRAMSGGEKTLTTLAFLFALHAYQPSPFYIFDELDAALDKENSEKLGLLLAEKSKQSQFIVISHNDNVISQADHLYGVSMNELGESQVVSIKLPEKK